MRRLYDSVNAASIPADAEMVAGYLDGRYSWGAADWARFPHAVRVEIVTSAIPNAGNVLDVERFDAAPFEAPGWVVRRRIFGADPTVYCDASTWPQVIAQFRAQRVDAPHWWIADYTGVEHCPVGAVACQWAGDVFAGTGGRVDITAVPGLWPGVDPPVPSAPAPERSRSTLLWP